MFQLSRIPKAARYVLGYDAVESIGRRKAPSIKTRSEDDELNAVQRKKLVVTARDLQRNFSIAAWAIRKHLDYVSTFTFKARTGDADFDADLESFIKWWGRRENCDAAGRHPLRRIVRLREARRTVDGDVLTHRWAGDGKLRIIEADRIATPLTGLPAVIDPRSIVHGVQIGPDGKTVGYVLCDRAYKSTSVTFKSIVDASEASLLAYYDRIDQVRGVSPLAASLNSFRDVYENFDYALAKAKVSQLFGLKFTRDGSGDLGNVTQQGGEQDDEGPRYEINYGSRGPLQIDLDQGDNVEVIESENPSDQFQSFTQEMIAVSLKSLDIPISFYDEGRANFSSGRQGWLLYDQSADTKREDNRDELDADTQFRVALGIANGVIKPPRGMRVTQIKWEWISRGIPWIDPLKEAAADAMLIKMGLSSRTRTLKEGGSGDFKAIIDELAAEQKYADEKGVQITDDDVQAAATAAANSAIHEPDPAEKNQ